MPTDQRVCAKIFGKVDEERVRMRKARLRSERAKPFIREIGASYAAHLDRNIPATLITLQSLAKTLARTPINGSFDRQAEKTMSLVYLCSFGVDSAWSY